MPSLLVGSLQIAPGVQLAVLLRWLRVVGDSLLVVSVLSLGVHLLREAFRPRAEVPAQRVVFGTSGHRGSSLSATFNEAHEDPARRELRRIEGERHAVERPGRR